MKRRILHRFAKKFAGMADEEIVQQYVDAAIEHSRLAPLDYVAVNVAAARIQAAYSMLKMRGQGSATKVLPLLEHLDVGVRGWAATHMLEFAPEEAAAALQTIAAAGGLRAFSARQVLKAWKGGTLKFPTPAEPPALESSRLDEALRSALAQQREVPPASAPSRLALLAPSLVEAFRRATPARQRHVAVRASEQAAAEVGVAMADEDYDVEDAQYVLRFETLPALAEYEQMKALAALLDEKALQLSGDANADKRTRGKAARIFAQARAASSLALCLTGDPGLLEDAVYEAIRAFDEQENGVRFIENMLTE
jgi:hypothetical protein